MSKTILQKLKECNGCKERGEIIKAAYGSLVDFLTDPRGKPFPFQEPRSPIPPNKQIAKKDIRS